jgi:phosphopantetheinyl transferase (holo-ACP synthase)
LKTTLSLGNLSIQFVLNKHLVPDYVHPKRNERKIIDRQKDFDAVGLCIAPHFSWDDITKVENGKPFIGSQFLGISHSNDKVVVCWSEENFGLDIQYVEEKIHRIASKFINDNELQFATNAEFLTLIWSAKEAVFKFHGHLVDFAGEMTVHPFGLDDEEFILHYHGKHHKNQYFRVSFKKIDDAYLTLALPQL